MSKAPWYVENIWYAAAWEHELAAADNKLARRICNVPLVLFKSENGGYVALDDRCCHRGAPLSLGRIEGDCIRCMYHGMLYNAQGQVIQIPGQDHISKNMKVESYPLVARGGMLWIWMGDPALADENAICDFPPMETPESWRGFEQGAYLHYQANWMLIVDNLADFSHVAFVHTNTLGGSEDYAYNTAAENIEKHVDGFSMERWDRNSACPPFHAKVIPAAEVEQKVDRANFIQMLLPGIFLMRTRFAPAGWNAEADDVDQLREYRNCQFMTPETESTTHFFWNYFHNWNMSDPSIIRSLEASLLEGFLEDKVFIESQQQLLADSDEFVPRIIGADAAFVHFRQCWQQRLDQEHANASVPDTSSSDRNRPLSQRVL